MNRHTKENLMKTMMTILAVAAIALTSCGDDKKKPDAAVHPDVAVDAYCSACPAAPALGPQIDRMGRPAINTALNHAFDQTTAAGPAKDAYNQDGSPAGWVAANVAQFMISAAILDALDTGLTCTLGACTLETTPTNGDGCGNQVAYAGPASATSYQAFAGLIANDQLYVDTSKTSCELASHQNFLAVEFNVVTTLPNSTCGGRAPTNDVVDTVYTAGAIGIQGFTADGQYTPFFGDGVGPHTDVSNDTFPFLGPPH
jgi:hypothetical protein